MTKIREIFIYYFFPNLFFVLFCFHLGNKNDRNIFILQHHTEGWEILNAAPPLRSAGLGPSVRTIYDKHYLKACAIKLLMVLVLDMKKLDATCERRCRRSSWILFQTS